MSAKVLVIEDNPTNLYLMEYLLTSFGYAVLTAGNGDVGLSIAAREQPDLIICDIQMPVMDGYEFIRQIKEHPQLSTTPVVAITAFAMVDDQQKMLSAGFDNYLSKPIDPRTFKEKMLNFLSINQQHAG